MKAILYIITLQDGRKAHIFCEPPFIGKHFEKAISFLPEKERTNWQSALLPMPLVYSENESMSIKEN